MTTVLHTADTHLGYRQYNSPERRRDFMAAFERVVSAAVERDVDAVVHAGDVFHDRRPGLADLLGTVSALRELAAADVPFLAIVGNHEDKRDAQWLDLFETLGLATRLDADGTVVGDTTFYGLDYVPRSRRDGLDYQFAPPETDHAALVAHGQFAPLAVSAGGEPWDLEAVLDASNVDFDAALLGDEHDADAVELDGTWATYAGSTERTSAAEREERGYNLVTFDGDVDVRRRGLPTREFVFADVELAGEEGTERVRERVDEHDLEDAVVVVSVDGDGGTVTPATVEEFARERGALVARVNDRRERESEEAPVEVSFADPDEAVEERVRELGLSDVARDIDEVVRTADLADANVREAVSGRVEERLDESAAFEPAPEPATDESSPEDEEPAADEVPAEDDAAAETPTPGDGSPGDGEADDDGSSAGDEAPAEDESPAEDVTATDEESTDEDDDDTVGESAAVDDDDTVEEPAGVEDVDAVEESAAEGDGAVVEESAGEDEAAVDEDLPADAADTQASMEEYL